MNKSTKISLRLKSGTYELLEQLLKDDREEAKRMNRVPINRSQMIDKCIKEYFANYHDDDLYVTYQKIANDTMLPIIQLAVSRIVKEITETKNQLEKIIEKYGLKNEFTSKLQMTAPNFADDEEMTRYYLTKDMAYEKIIAEEIERIFEEKGI